MSEESGLVRTRRNHYLLPKVGGTDSRSLWKSGNSAVLPLARFPVQDWIGGLDEVCGPWLTMAGTATSCWLTYHMLETTVARLKPGTRPPRLCEGQSQLLLSDALKLYLPFCFLEKSHWRDALELSK